MGHTASPSDLDSWLTRLPKLVETSGNWVVANCGFDDGRNAHEARKT